MRNFILYPRLLSTYFESITASDFQQHVVRYMVDQRLAPNTINGRIKTFKVFFAFLFRKGYLEQNIAEGLVLLKCPKNQIQTFSNAEMLLLLRQPDQTTFIGLRDYAMMIILLDTGIRIAGLLSLTLENVPLQIRTAQERIKDYGKMARIQGVRVSPHTFRHSMAKLYIRNGGDPFRYNRF